MESKIKSVVKTTWNNEEGKKCEIYRIYYKSGATRRINHRFHSLPLTIVEFMLNASSVETQYHQLEMYHHGKMVDYKREYFRN